MKNVFEKLAVIIIRVSTWIKSNRERTIDKRQSSSEPTTALATKLKKIAPANQLFLQHHTIQKTNRKLGYKNTIGRELAARR